LCPFWRRRLDEDDLLRRQPTCDRAGRPLLLPLRQARHGPLQ
jgi:hypothetical protein